MAAVAHAANDPDLVVVETKRLKDWDRDLVNAIIEQPERIGNHEEA